VAAHHIPNGVAHRNRVVSAGLGVRNPNIVTLEIHLAAPQREVIATPHTGSNSDRDHISQVRSLVNQLCEQAWLLLIEQVARAFVIDVQLLDLPAGVVRRHAVLDGEGEHL
jgi:hypothetical protein